MSRGYKIISGGTDKHLILVDLRNKGFLGKESAISLEKANIIVNKNNQKTLFFKVIGDSISEEEKIYRQQLKEKIKHYNLEKFFNIERGVPFQRIKSKYQDCDVFINLTDPSSLEKVVLEAMAMEKLVVTSNDTFLPLLSKFQDLLLVNKYDPDDLAKKIEKVIKLNTEEKNKIGRELREIVVEKHSLDRLIDNLLNIFSQLLKK